MSQNLYGLYRAVVVSNDDPMRRRRLQVIAPATGRDLQSWAKACVPSLEFPVPNVGDAVWIMFEAGDINCPVWMGVFPEYPS